jgi:hypothetical protein
MDFVGMTEGNVFSPQLRGVAKLARQDKSFESFDVYCGGRAGFFLGIFGHRISAPELVFES